VQSRRAAKAKASASRPIIFQLILLITLNTPRRRRSPRRPRAAAHRPEPRGIRPPTRRRQTGRPGSVARGRRGRGRCRPPIRRHGNAVRKRAWRIGLGSQASYSLSTDEVQGIEMAKTNAVLTSWDSHPALCRADVPPVRGEGVWRRATRGAVKPARVPRFVLGSLRNGRRPPSPHLSQQAGPRRPIWGWVETTGCGGIEDGRKVGRGGWREWGDEVK